MLVILVLLSAVPFIMAQANYTGHCVMHVKSPNAEKITILTDKMAEHNIDVLKMPRKLGEDIHVRLSPQQKDVFVATLDDCGLTYEIIINDLQSLIDSQAEERKARPKRAVGGFDLNRYNDVSQIAAFLSSVADQCSHCELRDIGRSYEGETIQGLKVGTGPRSVIIDGTIHAREWIAPATVLHLINKLAVNSNDDPTATALINEYTFYFVPMVNPDGYEYTTRDRMWRKTRSANQGSSCRGTDLNRNFGWHWGGGGASTDPCDETYRGATAFSELEARALRDYITSIPESTRHLYLTFHSYGDYILYPWGWGDCRERPSDDELAMMNMGNLFVNAIYRHNHKRFTIGQSACIYYVAAGGSDDWAKGGAGVPYSYTIELTELYNHGRYNFLLPEEAIPSVASEIWAGVTAMLGH